MDLQSIARAGTKRLRLFLLVDGLLFVK